MENLDFNINAVYREVLNRRQSEGALTYEEYSDLVDEVLEEKREQGALDDDFDFQQAREDLLARWNDVEAGTEEDNPSEKAEPTDADLMSLDEVAEKESRNARMNYQIDEDEYA